MSKIYINQSLIKKFFYKGEKRDYCAMSIKANTIDKTVSRESLSMTCGNYFETQCLGASIGGKKTLDLPRKKLTAKQILNGQTIGDKKIDQIRIDQQVMMFNKLKTEYQIPIEKEMNTQVGVKKIWSKNDNIILQGEIDIFPASIALPTRGLRLCAIDLKLTGIFSDYGEFCWGSPSNLDGIQGKMYHELIRDIDLDFNMQENPESTIHQVFTPTVRNILKNNDPLFFFWVFNYKEAISNKFIEVQYDKLAQAELHESIRRTVEELNKNERDNWQGMVSNIDNCSQCALLSCPSRTERIKEVEEQQNFEVI